MEAFKSPWSLVVHIWHDIIVEHVNIFDEIEGFLTAY